MDADWSGFHFLMERYIDTFFFPCLNALFLYLSIKFDLIYNKKSMLRWAKPFLIYVVPLLQNYLYYVNDITSLLIYWLPGCKTLTFYVNIDVTQLITVRYISPQSMYSLHHRLSQSLKLLYRQSVWWLQKSFSRVSRNYCIHFWLHG